MHPWWEWILTGWEEELDNELLRNSITVDEGAYVYSDRRHFRLGRRGSAESQLMQAWQMWPSRTDAIDLFQTFERSEH